MLKIRRAILQAVRALISSEFNQSKLGKHVDLKNAMLQGNLHSYMATTKVNL